MKILIAEDEENISMLYRIALESKGHEVIVTKNGEECVTQYESVASAIVSASAADVNSAPYDAVILDYRMPKMDGMDAAKHILKVYPKQRIIFASAFVQETLMESIKELDQIVELLQKPFEIDVLVDTVEDKTIYQQLSRLNVDIKNLRGWNPTHAQVRDLLDGLLKLRKPEFDLDKVGSKSSRKSRVSQTAPSAV
jgi:two-component system, chemotaxis family, chemotaxis protein CheY